MGCDIGQNPQSEVLDAATKWYMYVRTNVLRAAV